MDIEKIKELFSNLETALNKNTIEVWQPDNVDVHEVTLRWKSELCNEGWRNYNKTKDYMTEESAYTTESTEFSGYYDALMNLKNELYKGEKPDRYKYKYGICEWEWICFNDIRESGEFNMLDPRAREDSDIDKANWSVIVHNYEELEKFFN